MELKAINTPGAGRLKAGPSDSDNDEAWLRYWALHPAREQAEAMVEQRTTERITQTGRGLALSNADLTGLDLSGFYLCRATMNRTQLHSADLTGADLTEASMICPGMEKTALRGACLEGAYIHALAAQACDFRQANLDALVDATGSLFHGCNLSGATFRRASLAGTTMYQCDLAKAVFDGAALQGATFNESYLADARFERTGLDQVSFTKCWLGGVSLRAASGSGLVIQRPTQADRLCLAGASLNRLRLSEVRATGMDATETHAADADVMDCAFEYACFASANWNRSRWLSSSLNCANFDGAKLVEAQISRCRFTNLVLRSVQAENIHVVESAMPQADMREFSGRAAVFRDCDLSTANLERAYLYRAMITGDPPRSMSLRGAKLLGANLVQAYLAADLNGAELAGVAGAYARLNQSILSRANLRGAGFFAASFLKTDFTDAELCGIVGPFFVDRCPGLSKAIESAGMQELKDFLGKFEDVMRTQRRSST